MSEKRSQINKAKRKAKAMTAESDAEARGAIKSSASLSGGLVMERTANVRRASSRL